MHTIEAVFLAPLAVVVSLQLIFTGIVLYDRTAIDYALDAALIRGSEHSEMKNEELLHYVEDEFTRLLSGRLIMACGRLNVTVNYESITAEYEGQADLPRLINLTAGTSSAISSKLYSSGKAARIRRSVICRAVSALKTLTETKGE
ncbi:MAG: hypothetical protein K5686_08070 [Lachnospiraceae bacterium]|nr:hypothetical protein [Lachnospiraceae bacterium]